MQSIQRLLMEKCVLGEIYQFEKTQKKKLDARSLSSFSGTKSRTQGLYFPLVFFPSCVPSLHISDAVLAFYQFFFGGFNFFRMQQRAGLHFTCYESD